ncbi:MAG: hypothetical protein D6712_11530 [Chloroflexi bacterium]|nr:MAG: hypothetical protein D6712_11530 [Chloroflexota bacterium]
MSNQTIEITFEFQVQQGSNGSGGEHADSLEQHMLFEHTRASLERDIRRKLGRIVCNEHHEAPKIHITCTYDALNEQMDVNWNIDTCCKLFFVQVVKTLNQVN